MAIGPLYGSSAGLPQDWQQAHECRPEFGFSKDAKATRLDLFTRIDAGVGQHAKAEFVTIVFRDGLPLAPMKATRPSRSIA